MHKDQSRGVTAGCWEYVSGATCPLCQLDQAQWGVQESALALRTLNLVTGNAEADKLANELRDIHRRIGALTWKGKP